MIIAVSAAALLLAAPATQTPPARTPPPQAAPAAPSASLTRDLNSGPPAPATYLAPVPPPTPVPATTPAPSPRTSAPALAAPARAIPPSQPAPATTPRLTAAPPAAVPAAPTPAPAAAAPIVSPVETPVLAPPPPVAPPPPPTTVLDAAARAALPFSVDLPTGFEIVTGRPGPDFRIYTIRRNGQSFVMVYTGPASQFPIYSGQMVEAGGRASILSAGDGVRRAVEHLFERPTAPREIHVWTMSLDGADRDLAEQIAQSLDVR